ncbi:MAG TPA: hypothetical protein VEG34_16045 [Thermoanaerobaculia bacterium]|nr:hypothetical protein [Thermoanaerobaculia bacterium]
MTTPSNFQELQNGFYNAFLTGVGFNDGDPVQLLQPSNPLISGSNADTLLWQYFNFLPPDSLTASFMLSGGNQFLSNYQGVMSALEAQPNSFASTVGPDCLAAWQKAIQDGTVKLGSDIGTQFRNWAMFSQWSKVAVTGASAITRAFLDPVFAAQTNVLGYQPAGAAAVNFVPGYTDMTAALAVAPSRSFSVSQGTWNTSVTQQWSQSQSSGLFGLWGGSSSQSSISQKFSSGGVSVSANFNHVLQFADGPGIWYSSAAFGSAFNNPGASPWIAGNPITWGTTFGPGGNMERYTSNVLIVSGMDVEVVSVASFTDDEQAQVNNNQGAGMWPFYNSSSSSGMNTTSSFNTSGNLTVSIKSADNVPVVVAAWVLPASQYLGHQQQQ